MPATSTRTRWRVCFRIGGPPIAPYACHATAISRGARGHVSNPVDCTAAL